MKNTILLFLLIAGFTSQAQVTDIDGQAYKTVDIGTQTWMAENLNVSRFRNGDTIPEAKTFEEWVEYGEAKQPAWCYYDFDSVNGVRYGKLYNWRTVTDERGLAPEGWEIPSNSDWNILVYNQTKKLFFNGKIIPQKLKSNDGWDNDNNGTNESGFSALPGGKIYALNAGCADRDKVTFHSIGSSGYWWSTTEDLSADYWRRIKVFTIYRKAFSPFESSGSGLSVRCVKNSYDTVRIGNQTWMSENLNVSRFRNGDTIPEAKTYEEWKKADDNEQPAWCYYDNDPENGKKYGKLYNWYAVNDSRGLAPVGYHIPSDAEWKKITDFLGGEDFAGTKMKSKSSWLPDPVIKGGLLGIRIGFQDGNGTNTSGFSGLPGGYRGYYGTFQTIGENGFWWSSTEILTFYAWYHYLDNYFGKVYREYNVKRNGFSVRCVKN